MRSWILATLLALLLLIVATPLPLEAPAPAADAEGAYAPRFGAVETYHEPGLADDLGLGWTRIIFYWSELKKDGRDEWNWFHAPLDRIDREIEGGREVVGLLQHTPDFATDGPVGAGLPNGLYLSIDDPRNEWAVFCREVMSAYQGRITRWIIWNEPDIAPDVFGTLWTGSIADYYQLVKVAALVAEEVDPSIQIHLAGITYWHDPGYLEKFLTAAEADPEAAEHDYFFDVVTLHIYFRSESTIDIVESTRATLAAHGLEKPIWLNETNAPPFDDPVQPWVDPVFRVTSEMQGSFMVQEMALALALDLERVSLYKLVEEPPNPAREPYGLVRTDRSRLPAYESFAAATRYFGAVDGGLYLREALTMQVFLRRTDGATVRVFWARRAQDVTLRVPAQTGSALLIDQWGAAQQIEARAGAYTLELPGASCEPDGYCLMGGAPFILIEDAPLDLSSWEKLRASLSPAPSAAGASGSGFRPGAVIEAPPALLLGLALAAALILFVLKGKRHG